MAGSHDGPIVSTVYENTCSVVSTFTVGVPLISRIFPGRISQDIPVGKLPKTLAEVAPPPNSYLIVCGSASPSHKLWDAVCCGDIRSKSLALKTVMLPEYRSD